MFATTSAFRQPIRAANTVGSYASWRKSPQHPGSCHLPVGGQNVHPFPCVASIGAPVRRPLRYGRRCHRTGPLSPDTTRRGTASCNWSINVW